MNRIFVYGTLMRGRARADLVPATAAEPASTSGRLYHLRQGYPALIDVPEGQVFGELLEVPDLDGRLDALDTYEGEPYRRVLRPVIRPDGSEVSAWCYVVDIAHEAALVADGARLVEDGRWTG